MVKFVYRCTRPSLKVPWYQKTPKIQKLSEDAKIQGNLIDEQFKYTDNGLTLFITNTWINKDTYSDYINSPEMLEWRLDRSTYNSINNITFELYSKLED